MFMKEVAPRIAHLDPDVDGVSAQAAE